MALTGLAAPLLTQRGVFRRDHGFFGLPDAATFAFATFAGLCVGVLLSSALADRYGRRLILTLAPLIYGSATLVMAAQDSAFGICVWRLVVAIGLGAEVVAVDVYLAEIVSKASRGRGFALSKSIQYSAVPVATALAALCSLRPGQGMSGWHVLLLVPMLGAALVLWVRGDIPESPRWLALHGRAADATRIVDELEAAVLKAGGRLAAPQASVDAAAVVGYGALFRRPLRRRIAMMIVAGCASSIAYYGFANWLPSIIEARGVAVTRSLVYTALIACAYPLSPLCFALFADRIERKWQIVAGAAMVVGFGLAFAAQSGPAGWIACGLVLGIGNNLVACASHTYRSELFPTALRARAIGLVYSCDRMAAAFSSYLFAWLLVQIGVGGVLAAIVAAAFLDMAVIGVFGPRTRALASEEIGDRRASSSAMVSV